MIVNGTGAPNLSTLQAGLFAVLMGALPIYGCQAPPIRGIDPIRIEVLGFPDCPNSPEFRERVRIAAKEVGGFEIVWVDQRTLPVNDLRRGYPAPTALVHGIDLFGLAAPSSPSMSCRTYAGGLPSADEMAARLRQIRKQ